MGFSTTTQATVPAAAPPDMNRRWVPGASQGPELRPRWLTGHRIAPGSPPWARFPLSLSWAPILVPPYRSLRRVRRRSWFRGLTGSQPDTPLPLCRRYLDSCLAVDELEAPQLRQWAMSSAEIASTERERSAVPPTAGRQLVGSLSRVLSLGSACQAPGGQLNGVRSLPDRGTLN